MTKKELIEQLSQYDDDDIIVLARDSEGNGYSPLWSIAPMTFAPAWGEVFEREITEEMRKKGYTDEDLYTGDDAQKAVVLWP